MSRRRHALWALCGIAAGPLSVALGACADDSSVNLANRTDDGGTGRDTSTPDALFEGGSKPDAPTCTTCSADLHQVLDCDGKLLETCPPDQGCDGAKGSCVPACEAGALSKGSTACDFVVGTPSTFTFPPWLSPTCFAAFVTNTWPKAVHIQVARAGKDYDVTKFGRIAASGDPTTWAPVPASGLPPGQVAVLFLSDDPTSMSFVGDVPLTCPIEPAIRQPGGTAVWNGTNDATDFGQAFHIQTDFPVTAYDILPFGGAKSFLPSAELLLPTSAWGTTYVAVVPPQGEETTIPEFMQIVAAENGTVVEITPKTALPGGPDGGKPDPIPALTKGTLTLNAGDFIQWKPSGDNTGSILQSNKPIGFMGGHDDYKKHSATSANAGGDSVHQTFPPVAAVGSEYTAAPYLRQPQDATQESVPYRIVALTDGVDLTYDPPLPPDSDAPTFLDFGQVADFELKGPFTVKSQDSEHPFVFTQFMAGCYRGLDGWPGADGGIIDCLGDDDWINLYPPNQYLSRYVFFTDFSYSNTNLVFIRKRTETGWKDVTLDCVGTIANWSPVGAKGDYQVAYVDLVRNGSKNGACDNGPHEAKSEGAFGLVVWGFDQAASYGYPAGGAFRTLNKVKVPPVPN